MPTASVGRPSDDGTSERKLPDQVCVWIEEPLVERFKTSVVWNLGWAGDQVKEATDWLAAGKDTERLDKEDLPRLQAAVELYEALFSDNPPDTFIVSVYNPGESGMLEVYAPGRLLENVLSSATVDTTDDLRGCVGDGDHLGDGDVANAMEYLKELAAWQAKQDAVRKAVAA